MPPALLAIHVCAEPAWFVACGVRRRHVRSAPGCALTARRARLHYARRRRTCPGRRRTLLRGALTLPRPAQACMAHDIKRRPPFAEVCATLAQLRMQYGGGGVADCLSLEGPRALSCPR